MGVDTYINTPSTIIQKRVYKLTIFKVDSRREYFVIKCVVYVVEKIYPIPIVSLHTGHQGTRLNQAGPTCVYAQQREWVKNRGRRTK